MTRTEGRALTSLTRLFGSPAPGESGRRYWQIDAGVDDADACGVDTDPAAKLGGGVTVGDDAIHATDGGQPHGAVDGVFHGHVQAVDIHGRTRAANARGGAGQRRGEAAAGK